MESSRVSFIPACSCPNADEVRKAMIKSVSVAFFVVTDVLLDEWHALRARSPTV
jgi:hypothetical protein